MKIAVTRSLTKNFTSTNIQKITHLQYECHDIKLYYMNFRSKKKVTCVVLLPLCQWFDSHNCDASADKNYVHEI